MTTDRERVAAVRLLHAPSRAPYASTIRPECHGCDAEGWETEAPDWPCRTALALWDDAERDRLLADWSEWAGESRAATRRATPAGPTASLIPTLWAARLAEQIDRSMLWHTRLFSDHDEAGT